MGIEAQRSDQYHGAAPTVMDVSLWITAAVGIATLLGVAGRGLRRLWRVLLVIRDLTETVHQRSEQLTPGGGSMRDRIDAIYRWRREVESTLTDLTKRVSAVERRRR